MNIYKVEQDWNLEYDTYDSFVCVAETEQEAREIHPAGHKQTDASFSYWKKEPRLVGCWVAYSDIANLKVTEIGMAKDGALKGVIVSSFNAG
jgi:hypothetical protein